MCLKNVSLGPIDASLGRSLRAIDINDRLFVNKTLPLAIIVAHSWNEVAQKKNRRPVKVCQKEPKLKPTPDGPCSPA